MANSTGPIFAAGGITILDKIVKGSGKTPVGVAEVLKVGVATGIGALFLYGFEKVSEPLAVGIAWIVLVTVVLTSGVVTDLAKTVNLDK